MFISRNHKYELCKLDSDRYISPKELCWGVAGYNSRCVHICYEGCFVDQPESAMGLMSPFQYNAITEQIHTWQLRYPNALVVGHNDFPGVKKNALVLKFTRNFDICRSY